jgi:hypothetical protein
MSVRKSGGPVMRVAFYSDIHVEIKLNRVGKFRFSEDPKDPFPLYMGPSIQHLEGVDLIILAGDIGSASGVGNTVEYAAALVERLDCDVVVVPGNHEYYWQSSLSVARMDMLARRIVGSSPDDRDRFRFYLDRVHVLDRDEFVFEKDGERLRILGCTLWTDYAVNGDQDQAMTDLAKRINDHRLIRVQDGASVMSEKRVFTPADALAEHRESVSWLKAQLSQPCSEPTVVVTHHAPLQECEAPHFRNSPLSPGFVSRLEEVVDLASIRGVRYWIHGHTHWNHGGIDVGRLRVVTAQYGYDDERSEIGWTGIGEFTV